MDVGQRLRALCEDTLLRPSGVGIQGTHAANENRHLRRSQRQQLRPIDQQLLRRFSVFGSEVVAEPVRYQGSHHSHWPFF